jgi:hypothetical protein
MGHIGHEGLRIAALEEGARDTERDISGFY